MGEVYFYHLTQSSAEATLQQLLPRARAAGWKIELRSPDAKVLDHLDQALWLGPEDQFLAHGRAGGPHDADQPILLTTTPTEPARECLMCLNGADLTAAEVTAAARACILFDGHDQAALEKARDQWRQLTGDGCTAQYWAQSGQGWEKRAST